MEKKPFALFTVSQLGFLLRDGKCLILQLAKNNEWTFPGGRIDVGEENDGAAAFLRELREEIGCTKVEVGPMLDYDVWLNKKGVAKCGTIRVISTDEPIVLSSEHSDYRWISEDEITEYTYSWPQAMRMLQLGFQYYRTPSLSSR